MQCFVWCRQGGSEPVYPRLDQFTPSVDTQLIVDMDIWKNNISSDFFRAREPLQSRDIFALFKAFGIAEEV